MRPFCNPVIFAATPFGPVPLPAFATAVFDPYDVLVPYSNHHVVARAFGSTDPLSVADETVIAVAEPVTTPGAASVVKIPSLPRLVPDVDVATTR